MKKKNVLMKAFITFVITILLTTSSTFFPAEKTKAVSSSDESDQMFISAEKLMEEISKNPSLKIVDLRETSEYIMGHVLGAYSIPFQTLFCGSCTQKQLETYINSSVVLYAENMEEAETARETLLKRGLLDVKILENGLRGWVEEGYPLSDDEKLMENSFRFVGVNRYAVMSYIPEPMGDPDPVDRDSYNNKELPAEFSWKNYGGKDWTTPAKQQGSCGSCWDFAAIAALESIIEIANFDPDLDPDLSEQYVLSCLPAAGSCSGGNSELAFKYIISSSKDGNYVNGIIPESCFPYKMNDDVLCSEKCEDWLDKIIPVSQTGYWNLDGDKEEDRFFLKNKLIDYGPLVVYMSATNDFANWGSVHHSPNSYYPDPGSVGSINHAVLLVGYKDDPNIGNGGYWVCKNSWGTSFGYDGFFNLEYGALNIDNHAVYVKVRQNVLNPIAGASGPYEGVVNETLEFNGYAIRGTPPYTWHWDFGDGSVSDEQNPKHVYKKAGNYTITLSVTDTNENTYTYTTYALIKNVEVNCFGPYVSKPGDVINFQCTVSGGHPPYEYLWDFGDGFFSNEQNPVHVYNETGTYDVRVYVTYKNNTGKDSTEVVVENKKPFIDLAYPKKGIYLGKFRILPFFRSVIIGGTLELKADVFDEESGVKKTEFYIDEVFRYSDYLPPYSFRTFYPPAPGRHEIKIIAYDNAGNKNQYMTEIWMFL